MSDPLDPLDPAVAPAETPVEVAADPLASATPEAQAAVSAPAENCATPLANLAHAVQCAFEQLPTEIVSISSQVAERVVAEALEVGATDIADLKDKLRLLEEAFDDPATTGVEGVAHLLQAIADLRSGLNGLDGRVDVLEALPAALEAVRLASEGRDAAQDERLDSLKTRVEALEARPVGGGGGGTVDLSLINSTLGLHTEQLGNLSTKADEALAAAEAAEAAVNQAAQAAQAAQALAVAANEKALAAAACCETSLKCADVASALSGFSCDDLMGRFRGNAAAAVALAFPAP